MTGDGLAALCSVRLVPSLYAPPGELFLVGDRLVGEPAALGRLLARIWYWHYWSGLDAETRRLVRAAERRRAGRV